MVEFIFPDSNDAAAVVEDYLNWLVKGTVAAVERAQIIGNCVPPIKMVIGAAELASRGNMLEQEIFAAFIRDISSHLPNMPRLAEAVPGAIVRI